MSDIVAFLEARIDEDEQTECWVLDVTDDAHYFGDSDPEAARRVLAECKAKRAMLAELVEMKRFSELTTLPGPVAEALDRIAGFLAAPYADHPDFDPAWRMA